MPKAFLITYKPASENPERGWPLEALQNLVRRLREGEPVKETWRFQNRRNVATGDRVFLLLQGKEGPAIIGYGTVAGMPDKSNGNMASIAFDALVDPSKEVLANRRDILAIGGVPHLWRTQASGVLLPEDMATKLERLVVAGTPKDKNDEQASNPDWTRDELILALNVYLKHRPNPPREDSEAIIGLSAILNKLGEKLFRPDHRSDTFRNVNGVCMKLRNFLRLDPQYTNVGKKGLVRGAKAEEEVWNDFAGDAGRCQQVADAIIAAMVDREVGTAWLDIDLDEDIQEADEGRILTRKHIVRERNPALVKSKRKKAFKKFGKLSCEGCAFDFKVRYGEHGFGFIECHHTKPVATLGEGHKTHVDDLALVCANCHRMIHRSKPWLSMTKLKSILSGATN